MNETNSLIQIKGLRDGLLVSLSDAPWDEQLNALMSQVDAQPSFFQGARLALDVASPRSWDVCSVVGDSLKTAHKEIPLSESWSRKLTSSLTCNT